MRQTLKATIEMAAIDPLTGLNNRRFFETYVPSAIARARADGKPLAV
ncbi:MAG: diguanylate cyclase, partial [Alphaproteobacteria bacterium]